jgi:AAA+ ATPase superfamily predicted ATPase
VFAVQLEGILNDYEATARKFFERLAEEADKKEVTIDDLATFCDEDDVLQKVHTHIEDLLAIRTLPAVQRRLLNDIQQSLDAGLLPAVRKLAELLRTNAHTIGFCEPRAPGR